MDPVSASFLLKAGTAAASGASAFGAAKGQQQAAEQNAYIGRTRAIQTDASARAGLNQELGEIRNVFGANGQAAGVGTLEVVNELRSMRDRERSVNVGNRNAEAASARMQASNAKSAATRGLIGGAINAGPSLFDLYQYKRVG